MASSCQDGEDDMSVIADNIYAFFNPAGQLLSFFTDEFLSREPELAGKLLPVPSDKLGMYKIAPSNKCWKEVSSMAAGGECAALFYPTKRNQMKTVFFFQGNECFVRKDVSESLLRRCRFGFRQLRVPPTPIYRGPTVHDLAVEAVRCNGEDGIVQILSGFIEIDRKRFRGECGEALKGISLDAIPANCVRTADGEYRFFDLEYEMLGGVPLGYFIERCVATVVPRINREHAFSIATGKVAERVAVKFGEKVDWKRYRRICVAHKRFNTLSVSRVLTNVFLSLLPVRSWRERFCWWLMKPELKK
jgi:hypothetical protein